MTHRTLPFVGIAMVGSILCGLFLNSCDKASTVVGAGERRSLSDSTIMPQVIFTQPGNGAVGPFSVYDPGAGIQYPHFVIQFNKYIDTYNWKPGAVRVTGFSRPALVRVRPVPYYYYRLDKTTAYSDLLEFDVLDSTGYYYKLPYEVGRTYTVTVDTSLRDINNNRLQQPYTFSFVAEPTLRVLRIYPEPTGEKILASLYQFPSLLFNAKMTSTIFSSIVISPMPSGNWTFGGDSTYVTYSLTNHLNFNTNYTVVVPEGVTDRDGHVLPASFQASYWTYPFMISSAYPPNMSVDVPPNASFYFQATGRINASTLNGATSVSPSVSYTVSSYETSISVGPTYPGRFMTNTTYTIVFSSALKAQNSTALIPYSYQFTTQPFRINGSSPSGTGVYRYSSIEVWCNDVIAESTVVPSMSISPSVTGSVTLNYDQTGFWFYPPNGFAANTTYTVTISTGLQSSRGAALSAPYVFSFTTGD